VVVKIKRQINDKLIEICEKGFPNEVCGVLIGKKNKEIFIIDDYYVCENLNKERSIDRYELNPIDYIKAEDRAKKSDASIIGIYHSHPNHPAIASETDKMFAWPDMAYLIYSIYDGKFKNLISWQIDESEDVFAQINTELIDE
jgi:proteasome lid subunit RPN8/RPN11